MTVSALVDQLSDNPAAKMTAQESAERVRESRARMKKGRSPAHVGVSFVVMWCAKAHCRNLKSWGTNAVASPHRSFENMSDVNVCHSASSPNHSVREVFIFGVREGDADLT